MSGEIELKPCPFCGEQADDSATYFNDEQLLYWGRSVGCKGCDIFLDTPEEWNRRANE